MRLSFDLRYGAEEVRISRAGGPAPAFLYCHYPPICPRHISATPKSAQPRFDWGRYDGVKTLQASRFNLLSRHNDDRARANAVSTRHVALNLEAYCAFAVPGLRNVALTAPH